MGLNDNTEYIVLKTSDLKTISDELTLIRKELASLKMQVPTTQKVMNVDNVCAYMGWGRSTFEKMQRHPVLPLPTYRMGGVKVNYEDLIVWQQKYIKLQEQGKI